MELSAKVVDRAKRRRLNAEGAAAAIPQDVWDDFHERCRKAAARRACEPSASKPQPPRGKSRTHLVGRRRRHHNHVARRERQWEKQQASVAAAHLVRVKRIELLRRALLQCFSSQVLQ
jgi:hypothetical protein